MNEYPFFSVVIPTHNRAAFIETTLQTVLNQTYRRYEIIVVDDCSTDNTTELLQPYMRAGQINFIAHEQNYERARSRNTGMAAAIGDFVTFLDSDDLMYSNNLADAADYARAHPEIKCFQNRYELIDSQRNVLRRYRLPSLKNQLKEIASGNFMSCIGNFVHREIYQRYHFDTMPELSGTEDWDFWLRVLADYKVGRIEKINSGILHHDGRSLKNPNIESMKLGLSHICSKVSTDPHLSDVYRPYLKLIRANSLLYMAILANTGGLFGEARKYVMKAVKADVQSLANPRLWRVARRAWFTLQPQ